MQKGQCSINSSSSTAGVRLGEHGCTYMLNKKAKATAGYDVLKHAS